MAEDMAISVGTSVWQSEDCELRSVFNGGYHLLLSDDWTATVGQDHNHRERTWADVRAGVKSRTRAWQYERQVTGPAWYYAREAASGAPVRISYAAAGLFVHTGKGGRRKRANIDEHLPEIVDRVREAFARWDGTEGR